MGFQGRRCHPPSDRGPPVSGDRKGPSLTDPLGHPPGDVEDVFRDVYGQAIATLVRRFGDITLAEDAVQHAFVVAVERWPRDGIPPNPPAWIITTARNRAIDVARRATHGRRLHQLVAEATSSAVEVIDEGEDAWLPVKDDQLRLIFTCCHPALRREHQIALTLRLLGGLTVDEVARSFLVSEAAMSKRLVRAKYKIRAAGIPYRVPSEADLPERLHSVLSVLYLIYNAGADDPARASLRADAIRMARAVADAMPREPEAVGLLALLVLTESRYATRRSNGDVVPLGEQDRGQWNQTLIAEGVALVRWCIRNDRPGPFQIQAAIGAVHSSAPSLEATDWHQILTLYDQLRIHTPTPVVALNRAIALGEVEGPERALAVIDELAGGLDQYHLMHAARGTMLRRVGRTEDAIDAFRRAADLSVEEGDRRYLVEQVRRLTEV